jgi:protein-disulfide isomerase
MPPAENETKVTEKINPLLIPFSIIVAGALVGAGIYLSSKNPPVQSLGQIPDIEEINMLPVTDKDHILGNPNAPVVIVEYSDTECPFCKVFHLTMKRIMTEYGTDGKVAWVYRHFPIAELHSKAQKEAEATECVAELGGNEKFWQYLDAIFAQTNSNDTLDPSAPFYSKIHRD